MNRFKEYEFGDATAVIHLEAHSGHNCSCTNRWQHHVELWRKCSTQHRALLLIDAPDATASLHPSLDQLRA